MQLSLKQITELLNQHDLLIQGPCSDIVIESLSFHSKKLGQHCLFICKGNHFKKEYLEDIQSNLTAYMSEVDYQVDLPFFHVKDIMKAMAVVADAFYGHPCQSLNLIGITGTKGKTSSLYFLKSILDEATYAGNTAYLGTVEIYNGKEIVPSLLTTPESLTLQQIFRDVVDLGKENVIMEVSSQALKYDRVYGLPYHYGIFLNISNDHISDVEHPNFEDYLQSKLKLFDLSKVCILNLDLIDHVPEEMRKKVRTFSIHQPADIQAVDIQSSPEGSHFNVLYQGKIFPVFLNVPGLFNVENALSVILVALDMNIPIEAIQKGLSKATVPGRMIQIKHSDLPVVGIVDYAHNDASFTQIFKYAKEFYPNHQIKAIFGSPGNKAFNRRHELGHVANLYADEIYLVPDDPGYEDVLEINKQIQEVIDRPCFSFADRKEGIAEAFKNINQPTVVMVLGKGNENTQKVNGTTEPYENDEVLVKENMKVISFLRQS